jgi:outer membrane protein assembly factor BamB
MTSPTPETHAPSQSQPLRLWPGVVLLALAIVLRFGAPVVFPEAHFVAFLGPLGCSVLILIWWLFFSRAPWLERLAVVGFMVGALLVTKLVVHPSIAGGAMGYLLYVSALPVLGLALVGAVTVTRGHAARIRRVAVTVALVLGCGVFALLRTGGLTSTAGSDFHWRWSKTPEERLLADAGNKPASRTTTATAALVASAAKPAADRPGFRGARRDSVVRGTRIETNWTASPPVALWRRAVGPGWSSFAVNGGLIYTQEQRGEAEIVACYSLATGEPVWLHEDNTRFWESNAGAGPRGTPTLHEGRVYTFGATGVVNALDALTGAVVWTRNAATDTKKKAPDWGFASSPFVVDDLVVVAATGTLAAYDRATGAPRWQGPADGKSYSSPHLLEIDGVRQIVLMSGKGATSVAPADGKVLWEHGWPAFAIVQPAQIANGDLLISTGDRLGARRIHVKQTNGNWAVEERWTSTRLKAYFNDFVLHRGHAYGFDGGILACVELEAGERKWKGGRYGSGQVLLLADQDVLVVLSEQGTVALVAAKPDAFVELGNFKAIEGKTWNHPVLVGDVLLVRNDREMAAFKIAVKPANSLAIK